MADDDLSHLDFEPEEKPQTPVEVIHRQVLFDVAVNAKEIAEAVGLPPISDEQAAAEEAAKMVRLLRVNRLSPAIDDHAQFLAAVFIRIQREASKQHGVDVPDESWQSAYDHLYHMLNTSGMSLISTMVDVGALHLDDDWKQPSEQGTGT